MSLSEEVDVAQVDGNYSDLLAELQSQIFDAKSWRAIDFTNFLSTPGALAWLAVNSLKVPIGIVVSRHGGGECEIVHIGVLSHMRRKGIGVKLLEVVLEFARDKSAPVLLEVAENNIAAIGLYRKSGFVEVGRRHDYYRHRTIATDALIFRFDA